MRKTRFIGCILLILSLMIDTQGISAAAFPDAPMIDNVYSLPFAGAVRPSKIIVKSVDLSLFGVLTVEWVPDENAEGYRIEYSTSSAFSNPVTRYISGKKISEATITGLDISREYYVRVCGYSLSKDIQRIFGLWSNERTVSVPGLIKDQKISVKSSFSKSFSYNGKFNLNTSAKGKLSYSSSNKSVATVSSNGQVTMKGCGSTTITITAAATSGYKKAVKKVTVKILPAQVKNLAVKSGSTGKISFSWKQDKYVDGYEIQVSTSNSFPNNSSKTKKGFTKSNKIIKGDMGGLKSGLKYYVRVRGFKTVGKNRWEGAWSSERSIVVK